jgi:hypothetical protein
MTCREDIKLMCTTMQVGELNGGLSFLLKITTGRLRVAFVGLQTITNYIWLTSRELLVLWRYCVTPTGTPLKP